MRKKAPRMARINKQSMYYSLYSGTRPVYERDEHGDIIYVEVDGVSEPVEAGTQEASYAMPVPFFANIDSELNEMHMKAWGVDQSSIYAEIVCQKGYLPLEIGAIIWRESPVVYDPDPEDPEGVIPHQASADYTVVGVRTEGLTEDWYLLQKNSSDSDGTD